MLRDAGLPAHRGEKYGLAPIRATFPRSGLANGRGETWHEGVGQAGRVDIPGCAVGARGRGLRAGGRRPGLRRALVSRGHGLRELRLRRPSCCRRRSGSAPRAASPTSTRATPWPRSRATTPSTTSTATASCSGSASRTCRWWRAFAATPTPSRWRPCAPTSMPWTRPSSPCRRRSGTSCSPPSGPACWRWRPSARGARTPIT